MASRPLDGWSYNTLERLTVVGQRTYERARTRIVDWPTPKPPRPPCQDVEEPLVYTSLDEAFSNIVKLMSQTSKQCKRYYKSNPPSETQEVAQRHCDRFHAQSSRSHSRTPVCIIHCPTVTSNAYRQTDRQMPAEHYTSSFFT
ncbi:uncharacterized protein LOC132751864 [Ruditapes philippinarum]|uniref:uncharacterized protein LOC132751864 n=1 Tax=Ruditapes philippinarum TaxID=129788 RepID=UPI00295AD858|nr:uncharacterized protein LOC132751864 [Ruditapes philippinarum]